jgi:predicted TIM-barrel enzyme
MKEMFGKEKPIIALLHLRALPGDPLFNAKGSMKNTIFWAHEELGVLQDGGYIDRQ